MLSDALREAAQRVDRLLLSHEFPKRIQPDYLREAVLSYPRSGGKRVRPAIMLWCAALFGETAEAVLFPAAAAEMFHTWTLVHDDIIDRDETRRGNPTNHIELQTYASENFKGDAEMHARFGISMAILSGDLQQAWSLSLLQSAIDNGMNSDIVQAIQERMLNELYPHLLAGEALDIDFEYRDINDISSEQILEMLRLKTGELLKFSAETGILIGLNTPNYRLSEVRHAGEFALKAGLAFQLHDDILGLYADKPEWGKPLGSDVRCGKITLLFKEALEMCSQEEKQFLLLHHGNEKMTDAQFQQVVDIVNNCGALAKIKDMAKSYVNEARESLHLLPESKYRNLLEDMAEFFINRQH